MIQMIGRVDLHEAGWLLVIEKEVAISDPHIPLRWLISTKATFRTLAVSRYHSRSAAGPGILVTVSAERLRDTSS